MPNPTFSDLESKYDLYNDPEIMAHRRAVLDAAYAARMKDQSDRIQQTMQATKQVAKDTGNLLYDFVVPQDMFDVGLMLLPFGKPARVVGGEVVEAAKLGIPKLGAAIASLGYTPETEAGRLSYLSRLGNKEQVATEFPGSLSYGTRDTINPNALFNKTFATPRGAVVEHSHPNNTAPILSSRDLTHFIEMLKQPGRTVSPRIKVVSGRGEFEVSPKVEMSPAKYADALDELRLKYDLATSKRIARQYKEDADPTEKGALLSGHPKLDVKFNGRKYSKGGLAKRIGKMFDKDPVPAKLQGTQVIKEPGGNFLADTVERVVSPMKTRVVGSDPAQRLKDLDAAYAQNVEAGVAMDPAAFARERARLLPEVAMNRWLDTKLDKYFRNEMATPGDPLRAMAERGVLHYDPTLTGYSVSKQRVAAGFPEEGMAKSGLAQRWEKRADTLFNELKASDLIKGYPEQIETNPWLLKVPPETRVYEMLGGADEELGMRHLVDEMRNAINPASGLPDDLLWKYSDLDKVTVPQAVQRVSDINAWRAAQKAEADLALSMNQATHVFKEYPEQGLRWVEIRQPKETGRKVSVERSEMDLPMDVDQRQMREVAEDMAFDEGLEEGTPEFNDFVRDMMTDFNSKKNVDVDESMKALEDALRYEGDTMGHCVGRYCEDVASGQSRIFSLRDDKGMPRVTIETQPGPRIFDTGTPEGRPGLEKIVQIKGSGKKDINQKLRLKGTGYPDEPDAWLLPAVQDFVRGGEWSDVRELGNAGLVRLPDRRFITKEQFDEGIQRLTKEGDPTINAEWFGRQINRDPAWWDAAKGAFEGFAGGGLVRRMAKYLNPDQAPARLQGTEVIKESGGNWLSGSAEKAIDPLRPRGPTNRDEALMLGGSWTKFLDTPAGVAQIARNAALNNWLDAKLTKYIKKDLGTPGDPVRALAEKGILHYDPQGGISGGTLANAALNRGRTRNDAAGIGESTLAKGWETHADAGLGVDTASKWRANASPDVLARIPGIGKIKDDDFIYEIQNPNLAGSLGLPHLIDEMSAAIYPNSDLPANLRWKYSDLDKVTVPQAVERVAKINDWRAEQARLADLATMKANLLQKPYKEYEGSWRWVELPDAADPEGVKLVKNVGCQGGWCTKTESGALTYGSHGEGNRLYALIDKEGRPHIQISTELQPSYGDAHLERFRKQAQDEVLASGLHPGTMDDPSAKFLGAVNRRMTELANENLPLSITQIKPFSNRWDSRMVEDFTAKNPQYREELTPMIQDFVTSGQWSDVGDLGNAGLVDLIARGVPENLLDGKRFATEAEYRDLVKKGAAGLSGFAGGGLVKRMGKYFSPDQAPAKLQGTDVIKEPGGNWVAGSVERAIDPLKKTVLEYRPPAFPDLPAHGAEAALVARNARNNALNRWLDTKLTKYIKNEMATPNDPVRALAEKGVLHVAPEQLNFRLGAHGKNLAPGQTAVARSPKAKAWEGASDLLIGYTPAGQMLQHGSVRPGMSWLSKVPPETPVYDISDMYTAADSGLYHLVDELQNALNPSSGLPANLLWKYSDLEKVSVPQAVQRVSDINAWRAAQKAEADLALSMNPATHVFREYPEQGLKWVELRHNAKAPLPEGYSLDKSGNTLDQHGNYVRDPREQSLEDALNYEGDTMGHCVGGYCEDVLSGAKRIFSLRDDKGMPHVTVETRPGDFSSAFNNLTQDEQVAVRKVAGDWASDEDLLTAMRQVVPDKAVIPERIVQIKGSGKKDAGQRLRIKGTGYSDEPDARLLPAVQDFVKSQNWTDVGDIQNTGLIDARVAGKPMPGRPSFMTEAEFKAYQDELSGGANSAEGFAEGGLVEADPSLVEEFMRRLKLSGSVSSFKDGEVKGIGGGGNISYDVLPSLTLGADVSGYSVNTPEGKFSDKSLDALTGEYRKGPHSVRFRKGIGDNKKAWGVEYRYNFAGGGLVKSLDELVDHYIRKVRKMDNLGTPTYSVHRVEAPASAEVPGWHITQDLQGILKTGALTNRAVGAGNTQGWVPAHVGGAYFYSDPRLAAMKHKELTEMMGEDLAFAAEMPILRAQLQRGNRLVPDEDVSLTVPWQESYQQGSFATTRPVMLNQVDRIYTLDPDVTKDMIRDTVIRQRRQGYADGGLVQYDPVAVDSMADDLRGMIYG